MAASTWPLRPCTLSQRDSNPLQPYLSQKQLGREIRLCFRIKSSIASCFEDQGKWMHLHHALAIKGVSTRHCLQRRASETASSLLPFTSSNRSKPYFVSQFNIGSKLLTSFMFDNVKIHSSVDQVWLGYWTDPEDADGWGYVHAYILPL